MSDSDASLFVILAPATDIASLTLNWPANPIDGEIVTILSTKAIASITHVGATLNKNIASIRASGSVSFIWDQAGSVWMTSSGDQNSTQASVSLAYNSTVTGGAGDCVMYLTDTGLVGGSALFSTIEYVGVSFDIADPNYDNAKPVVSNSNKTLTIHCVKQTFSGVTVVGINVLGSVAIASAPNGTALSILVQGKLS